MKNNTLKKSIIKNSDIILKNGPVYRFKTIEELYTKENILNHLKIILDDKIADEIKIYIAKVKINDKENQVIPTDFSQIIEPVNQIISLYENIKNIKENSIIMKNDNIFKLYKIIKEYQNKSTDSLIKILNSTNFTEITKIISENKIIEKFDEIYTRMEEKKKDQKSLIHTNPIIKNKFLSYNR